MEKTHDVKVRRGSGGPKASPIPWTQRRLDVVKIGDEPPLNEKGFWKRFEYPKVKKDD